ncbi:MAG: phosphatidate cytidylyltransferase [Erysipelotrichales bacterium]|nr:phosphatidate cytidylyltransferase [Erysipelotrichales bacterium]
MNKLSDDSKKSMVQRIITSVVLLVLCVPCLLFGNWFFASLSFVASFFACHEFINAPKNKSYNIFLHVFIHIMTYSFIYWVFIKTNLNTYGWDITQWSFATGFSTLNISIIGIAVGFLTLFFMTLNHNKFNISDATYLCTMMVFIGISIQSALFLRFYPAHLHGMNHGVLDISNSTLFIYVVIGSFLSDIGAYFFGILFGRNKMNARISPKKTWEGFIGGVLVSAIISFAFAFILAKADKPLLKGILDVEHFYNIIILSLAMPITANLGDFIFSSIKRNYGIKDFGTILKGHGGVLDRLDSLFVTSLIVSIIIIFMGNNWSLLA